MEEQLPPCRISSSSPDWQPACAPSLQTNVMEITASTPQQRTLSVLGTSETCWCQQQGKLALSLIPAGQNIRDNEDRTGSPRLAGKQTCDSLAQHTLQIVPEISLRDLPPCQDLPNRFFCQSKPGLCWSMKNILGQPIPPQLSGKTQIYPCGWKAFTVDLQ